MRNLIQNIKKFPSVGEMLLVLRYYIRNRPLLFIKIVTFVETLAHNPYVVQNAISCLTKQERKLLVSYLRQLRMHSPSCYILFYSANKLELLGKDTYHLLYWMAWNLKPTPVYSQKGFVTRCWAVLQQSIENLGQPVLGTWTLQRILTYQQFLASKLERLSNNWNSKVDSYIFLQDNETKNELLVRDAVNYFCRKNVIHLNDENIWQKILAAVNCKINDMQCTNIDWVKDAMVKFNNSHQNSVTSVKREIVIINKQLSLKQDFVSWLG